MAAGSFLCGSSRFGCTLSCLVKNRRFFESCFSSHLYFAILLEIFSQPLLHKKVSNSALVSPSVNIKLQQIFTAYRGNHSRDDNDLGDHSSALSLPLPPYVSVCSSKPCQLVLWNMDVLVCYRGLCSLFSVKREILLYVPLRWQTGCFLLCIREPGSVFCSLVSLSLALLPPAFSFVITVCKIAVASTHCVLCRQQGNEGGGTPVVNCWRVSQCSTEQHERAVFTFQNEPNVQTLLVIPFMQNIQGLLNLLSLFVQNMTPSPQAFPHCIPELQPVRVAFSSFMETRASTLPDNSQGPA